MPLFAIENHLKGPLVGPSVKFGSIIPCQYLGKPSTEQVKNLVPIVKNHTGLGDRIASIDNTKFSGENIEQVTWQTFINNQIPKLKIQVYGIEIEG